MLFCLSCLAEDAQVQFPAGKYTNMQYATSGYMCLKYSDLIKMVRSANGSDVNSAGLEVFIGNEDTYNFD